MKEPECRLGAKHGAVEIKSHPWFKVRMISCLCVCVCLSVCLSVCTCVCIVMQYSVV